MIEAFADSTPGSPSGQDAGGTEIGVQQFQCFLTRWAILPEQADWLDAGTSWSWDDSGLRPVGLVAGTRMEAWMGPLAELPITTNGRRGWFTPGTFTGTGGIDAIVRAAAGDEFPGVFADGR